MGTKEAYFNDTSTTQGLGVNSTLSYMPVEEKTTLSWHHDIDHVDSSCETSEGNEDQCHEELYTSSDFSTQSQDEDDEEDEEEIYKDVNESHQHMWSGINGAEVGGSYYCCFDGFEGSGWSVCPRSMDNSEFKPQEGREGPITTMMIQNLPSKWGLDDVLDYIDARGFDEKYDFFYLPKTCRRSSNLGFAFINFQDPESAVEFQTQMTGLLFSARSSKVCCVCPSNIQGLVAMKSFLQPGFF